MCSNYLVFHSSDVMSIEIVWFGKVEEIMKEKKKKREKEKKKREKEKKKTELKGCQGKGAAIPVGISR